MNGTLCRTCGTDTREGTHNVAEMSADGNSVTISCVFPRESSLPRAVNYITMPDVASEYWYRPQPSEQPIEQLRARQSPAEVQRAHLDTFGDGR